MAFRFGPVVAFSAFLIVSSSLLADSIDDAEAKKRGVPVQQVQLERFTAQNADLQTKLTAATAQNAALKKQIDQLNAAFKTQVDQLNAKIAELTKKLALVTPSNNLAADGVPEITAAALEVMGEKYTEKDVKMTGLIFVQVFPAHIYNLPEADEALGAEVIEFAAEDSKGGIFERFFVSKKNYGELIVNLKAGQVINVRGRTIRLFNSVHYSFVCNKFEVVPTTTSPSGG